MKRMAMPKTIQPMQPTLYGRAFSSPEWLCLAEVMTGRDTEAMNAISKLRFDALAGYSRTPWLCMLVDEFGWFESANEKVLGMLAFDVSNEDYDYFILGRDAKGGFRAVDVECSIPTAEEAKARLETQLEIYAKKPPEEFFQGDETGKPMDFFTPIVEDDVTNPSFRQLISERALSPARELLAELMHYFEDADGNFVQNFQSGGFDARVWELYLYAAFTELGYGFDRSYPAPDFHCIGLRGEFFVEATTVNPSADPPDVGDSPPLHYFEHYVPRKFGSVLFSKLKKKYWELQHVSGRPLIYAVQDFHTVRAMTWSNTSLVEYLYGIRQIRRNNADGSSSIVSEPIDEFVWDGKTIAAGFFNQPDTENVSAVIANPEGTISKFKRMGFLAGFGDRSIRMIRNGQAYSGSLDAENFVREVTAPGYSETWCEGLSVYHNPNAKHPLPRQAIPGAAHHTSGDGRILCRLPPFHPVGSLTFTIIPQPSSLNRKTR